MKTSEVCKDFISGVTSSPTQKSVWILDDRLYSYNAVICVRCKDQAEDYFRLVDPYRHSSTTTKHMNLIFNELLQANVTFFDDTIHKTTRMKTHGAGLSNEGWNLTIIPKHKVQ